MPVSERREEGGEPTGYSSLRQLALFTKYNFRALLSPVNLLLLAVAAMLAYYSFTSAFDLRGASNESWLTSWFGEMYDEQGISGLHPLYYMRYPSQFAFMFNAVGVPIIAYLSACNLIAEDSGGLPSNLLLSRPISRSMFLVVGFSIRASFSILFGYLIPSVVGYSQDVADMSGAAGAFLSDGSPITIEQWKAMAWDGMFWQYVGLFALFLLATASLALLATVLKGRGIITLPLITGLTYLLTFTVGSDLDYYVSPGATRYIIGEGAHPFPVYGIFFPSFYLLAPIWSTPHLRAAVVENPVTGFPEGLLCLTIYTVVAVLLSVITYRMRDKGG